ncbi:MAG: GMC family oxidoreductase [Candidatus Aminicenantes bacterium]|nr:GMC family oxidoreductase [Candidatus Aminicenantes bacterium]
MKTEKSPNPVNLEYDYVIIGSGFGGSVCALRLIEKGYRVCVVECGRRYQPADFPRSNWEVWEYLWAPRIFCYGIQRLYLLNDVLILGGSGVGGGSLVYGNTLLEPPASFYRDPAWMQLESDWEAVLHPHFEVAKKMLGVTTNPGTCQADTLLREYGSEINRSGYFRSTEVGVFFGEPGVKVPDPYFNGKGPSRTGCGKTGHCMVGCRGDGKNSLDKNYLYLGEQMGLDIISEHQVIDINPAGNGGYVLEAEKVTDLWIRRKKILKARGVVLAAGVIGTLDLLMKCREKGHLPDLSPRLGHMVRTNSETLAGLTVKKSKNLKPSGIAITSELQVDENTHIQVLRYPPGSDLLLMLGVPMVDGGTRVPRILKFFWTCLKSPLNTIRVLWPFGKAKKSIILLVMQTLNNYLTLSRRRRWWSLFRKVIASRNDGWRIPNYIPTANQTARKIAEKIDALPQNGINETILNIPMTAHILGGCIMGQDRDSGVIDKYHRVYGYEHLYVVDGSIIPANLGVNPSLTITAMAERAMSHIPPKNNA